MKSTDYAPRAAPFDTYLTPAHAVGVEVGVDVGAHAEALLRYTTIQTLYLVDPWPRELYRGWCEGRLRALGFAMRIEFMHMTSRGALDRFPNAECLDFVYLDQYQSEAVGDLGRWWPKVRPGGIVGVRNYAESQPELKAGVNAFIEAHRVRAKVETGEIVLWKD